MVFTRHIVAEKIAAHLQNRLTLGELVDWAEMSLMDGEISEEEAGHLSQIAARLGVVDVRAFGLTWEDCEQLLRQFGYTARIQVVPA